MKENVVQRVDGTYIKECYGCASKQRRKTVYEGFGEFLFTHFGVSGPLVLTASTCLGKYQKGVRGRRIKTDS